MNSRKIIIFALISGIISTSIIVPRKSYAVDPTLITICGVGVGWLTILGLIAKDGIKIDKAKNFLASGSAESEALKSWVRKELPLQWEKTKHNLTDLQLVVSDWPLAARIYANQYIQQGCNLSKIPQ